MTDINELDKLRSSAVIIWTPFGNDEQGHPKGWTPQGFAAVADAVDAILDGSISGPRIVTVPHWALNS